MICDVNINLGYEGNVFNVLGGNVDDYNPSIDHCCVCLGGLPMKFMWATLFNSSYDLSKTFE